MSATHLNLARTVCRRAERSVIPLIEQDLADQEVGRYLNRLSDFLFAAQRTAVQREKRTEILWVKQQVEEEKSADGAAAAAGPATDNA
jgi:ATP:cob(I)alamin adenosyltransferase